MASQNSRRLSVFLTDVKDMFQYESPYSDTFGFLLDYMMCMVFIFNGEGDLVFISFPDD